MGGGSVACRARTIWMPISVVGQGNVMVTDYLLEAASTFRQNRENSLRVRRCQESQNVTFEATQDNQGRVWS